MACNNPYHAFLVTDFYGNRKLIFSDLCSFLSDKYVSSIRMLVPCGRCMGCKLDYARDWTVRNYHESLCHDKNCFITLTYDDDNVPITVDGEMTLNFDDLTKFLKRFRKYLSKKDIKIRYFACGEYGAKTWRPHYHILIYGYDFEDKVLHHVDKYGFNLYISETLSKLWKFGFSLIGSVNYQSIAYVSRYIVKKSKGDDGKKWRNNSDRVQESVRMSRMPGLGLEYFKLHYNDWFANNCCPIMKNGKVKKLPIPHYYVRQLESLDNELYKNVIDSRIEYALASVNKYCENFDDVRNELFSREFALRDFQNKLDRDIKE